MYNVMLGQGQCNLNDFEERSELVPRLAAFKPDTTISLLGKIARPLADAAYTFCVLNSDTGNRFCFEA